MSLLSGAVIQCCSLSPSIGSLVEDGSKREREERWVNFTLNQFLLGPSSRSQPPPPTPLAGACSQTCVPRGSVL